MLSRSARRFAYGAATCLGVALAAVPALQSQPASAQDADVSAQYAALLQQISDTRINIALNEFYVAQQEETIETLRADIAAAEESDPSAVLMPIVREMVGELEKLMTSDIPFQVERRFALLDSLREDMQEGEGISASEAFRRAMELYGQETEAGLQVDATNGLNPVNPGGRYAACLENVDSPVCDLSEEQTRALSNGATVEVLREQIYDGTYVNFGRLALLYLERDSSVGYRYDNDAREWVEMPRSSLLALRQNVRIARGDSAIDTMTVPVLIGSAGADAS